MGCATSLVKFLIFLFNFVFVAGGVALITFGALFYNGYKTYESILPDLGPYTFPPILMMVVGGVVFIIAFMGCCGTIRESKCMMMTYAVLLLILLIAEVAIAVGIYTHQAELKELLRDGLTSSMKDYKTKTEVQEAWDLMQSTLHCCGVENFSDWGPLNVPESCCVNPGESCTGIGNQVFSALTDSGKIFNEGCVSKIFSELKTDYGMYAAAILAAVELLGVVFGCCLGARFGRKLYHT